MFWSTLFYLVYDRRCAAAADDDVAGDSDFVGVAAAEVTVAGPFGHFFDSFLILFKYCLGTFWILLGHFLGTIWILVGHLLGTFWILFGHFLGTFWILVGDLLDTF